MTLLPWSWFFGFIYTFGIPFTFYLILVQNKDRVKADIELSAQVGNGQLECVKLDRGAGILRVA